MTYCPPEVSVIVSFFDPLDNLQRTLSSVSHQSSSAKEVLIVNQTAVNLDNVFPDRFHESTVFQHQYDSYLTKMRKALMNTTSDFVIFLCAGDLWEPHFIEEVLTLAVAFPKSEFLTTGYQFLDDMDNYRDPKIAFLKNPKKPIKFENYFEIASSGDLPFQLSSFCCKKSVLKNLLNISADNWAEFEHELFIYAAERNGIAYSPRVLSFRRSGIVVDVDNRAAGEPAFSRKLYEKAIMEINDSNLRESMIDYSAKHLLSMVQFNILSCHFAEASVLLRDKRCKRYLIEYLKLKALLLIKRSGVWA